MGSMWTSRVGVGHTRDHSGCLETGIEGVTGERRDCSGSSKLLALEPMLSGVTVDAWRLGGMVQVTLVPLCASQGSLHGQGQHEVNTGNPLPSGYRREVSSVWVV